MWHRTGYATELRSAALLSARGNGRARFGRGELPAQSSRPLRSGSMGVALWTADSELEVDERHDVAALDLL